MRNTTLEDICAVVGFEAAKHLSAWFGGRNARVWVPAEPEEGQILVKLIGMDKARRLGHEWGNDHLMVPSMHDYETLVMRRQICRMAERGFGCREIANYFRISDRRVQQICRELEREGLLEKSPQENAPGKTPLEMEGGLADDDSGPASATTTSVVHRLRK